jgi:AraC family ethanolamine operon transcriptional activator
MEIPQAMPIRTIRLATGDPDVIAAAQPERRRSYEQIAPGPFRGDMVEEAFGQAAILRERWSCGVRVRCDRPPGYVAFCIPLAVGGDVRWCGKVLEPGVIMRVDAPWEIATRGAFDFVAFGVDTVALDAVAAQLAGREWRGAPSGNALLRRANAGWLGERVAHLQHVLGSAAARPEALDAAAASLLHLAASLDRIGEANPVGRLSTPSQRRAAVRRIEVYLEAHRGQMPSVPTLCGVAGVSERTLEYAFREHVGVTPVRYLKLRRLNQVRRALRAPESAGASVTEIALRVGFYDLGRFAGEYRSLFGELPSRTLAESRVRFGRARLGPDPLAGAI